MSIYCIKYYNPGKNIFLTQSFNYLLKCLQNSEKIVSAHHLTFPVTIIREFLHTSSVSQKQYCFFWCKRVRCCHSSAGFFVLLKESQLPQFVQRPPKFPTDQSAHCKYVSSHLQWRKVIFTGQNSHKELHTLKNGRSLREHPQPPN